MNGRSGGADANRMVCGRLRKELSCSFGRRPIGVRASRPAIHGGALWRLLQDMVICKGLLPE